MDELAHQWRLRQIDQRGAFFLLIDLVIAAAIWCGA